MEVEQKNQFSKNNSDTPFFKTFAMSYPDSLGKNNPNRKQLAEIQSLLSDIWRRQSININLHLSQHEKRCLCLSAQGKKFKEIANHLNVSQREVSQYRQSILQKLGCKTMNSAIIVGIRYGEIKAEELLPAG